MDERSDRSTRAERKSEREFVVTRTLNAPAHIVFAAWTKPDLFKQWWVPKSTGMTLLSCEMDVRVGGGYRLVFTHPAFPEPMTFHGRYVEVTPHARIVWTNDESEDGAVTTVTFEERGGKTALVVHDLYPSKEALDREIASGATSGMPAQLAQLEEFIISLLRSKEVETRDGEFPSKPALKRLQWSIDIVAPASKVYEMLVGPESYTQWTSAFGDGLYFDGSWQNGQRMRFLTPSGHGVVSEIAENRPNAFLSVRHLGYIDDNGVEDTSSDAIRAWAPAYENFTFTATPQGTKLTVDQDMTDAFESMPEAWPKALQKLKALCEGGAESPERP